MNIKCPHCGTEYEVAQKDFGRFTTCETCGKGFVIGTKPGDRAGEVGDASQPAGGRSSSMAAWICAAVLVLNLAALVAACCLVHGGFDRIDAEMAELHKSIDAMNEDLGNSALSLKRTIEEADKSRHHDASQIYDRMGRMKLY